jgi:integrase/recombinase XerC/integrase/recombinase XerD
LKDFLSLAHSIEDSTPEKSFLKIAHLVQKKLWSRLAPSSHQRKIACLKSFSKFLQQRRVLTEPVEHHLFSPRLQLKIPRYLTVDECLRCASFILKKQYPHKDLQEQQTQQIFFLLYLLGLRVSEAVNLRWQDFNFPNQTLLVVGKGGKQRIVAFPKVLESLLLDTKSQSEYVIPRPMTPQKAYSLMRQLGEAVGLNKILNPHALRHSYATHLLSDGMSLRVLQGLLGHTSLAATQKYTHLSIDHLSRLVDSQHPLSKKLS